MIDLDRSVGGLERPISLQMQFPVPVDPRDQDLSHRKLAVYDIFTSSYGQTDLTSVSAEVGVGLETL